LWVHRLPRHRVCRSMSVKKPCNGKDDLQSTKWSSYKAESLRQWPIFQGKDFSWDGLGDRYTSQSNANEYPTAYQSWHCLCLRGYHCACEGNEGWQGCQVSPVDHIRKPTHDGWKHCLNEKWTLLRLTKKSRPMIGSQLTWMTHPTIAGCPRSRTMKAMTFPTATTTNTCDITLLRKLISKAHTQIWVKFIHE